MNFTRFGNHPYVSYASAHDASGQFWIFCQCVLCGDTWNKPCQDPRRLGHWVSLYALEHAHGLQPVRR